MFIDSHCHLHFLDLEKLALSLDDIINNAKNMQVKKFLCVATHPDQQDLLINIAKQFPEVVISAGIHPNEEIAAELSADDWIQQIRQFPDRIVAIGETGLDYYRSQDKDTKELQRKRFSAQIQAALQLNKPLIVHTRAAQQDTIDILKQEQADNVSGVLHCFTEDWDMASKALDLNFYLSFSGIITFSNAAVIREVVKKVPLDRILIETDTPYLAPVPMRGKINQPEYVRFVAEKIAEIKNLSLAAVAKATTANFERLFIRS